MALKISKSLKSKWSGSGIAPVVGEYERRYRNAQNGELAEEKREYKRFTGIYYDLVTDFYEYGWGRSFHFAPRVPGESFKASLTRHEHFLAHKLDLRPGMVVADLGCGIGGPMLEIARFSGAKLVGVNINAHQLERASQLAEEAGLTDQVEFLECDFLHVDAPDESFDAVYGIEATCCAPNKVSIYGEAHRLLKPGGYFGNYEYILTDRFDAANLDHRRIKADIELGGGLLDIDYRSTVDDALRTVGFEILEASDLAEQDGPSIPWYQPFVGSGVSLASFRSSGIGRAITHQSIRVLERLGIAPRGSARVAENLNLCAAAMTEAGRLGIFSPMYFVLARKPE